jgi:hypothetical protein
VNQDLIRQYLATNDLEWSEPSAGQFQFSLPGVKKLATPTRILLSPHSVTFEAFVCRAPDENHEAVYRWLLERNLRLFSVSFAVDRLGDIFLHTKLPLSVLTETNLDRVLGSLLTAADESFNTLLELGFSSAIKREWKWRQERGESTANLAAFRGWLESEPP